MPYFAARLIFSSPVRMYRKSYCPTPGVSVGVGSGVDKFYIKVF